MMIIYRDAESKMILGIYFDCNSIPHWLSELRQTYTTFQVAMLLEHMHSLYWAIAEARDPHSTEICIMDDHELQGSALHIYQRPGEWQINLRNIGEFDRFIRDFEDDDRVTWYEFPFWVKGNIDECEMGDFKEVRSHE